MLPSLIAAASPGRDIVIFSDELHRTPLSSAFQALRSKVGISSADRAFRKASRYPEFRAAPADGTQTGRQHARAPRCGDNFT
jgi:hypothetical protein